MSPGEESSATWSGSMHWYAKIWIFFNLFVLLFLFNILVVPLICKHGLSLRRHLFSEIAHTNMSCTCWRNQNNYKACLNKFSGQLNWKWWLEWIFCVHFMHMSTWFSFNMFISRIKLCWVSPLILQELYYFLLNLTIGYHAIKTSKTLFIAHLA